MVRRGEGRGRVERRGEGRGRGGKEGEGRGRVVRGEGGW